MFTNTVKETFIISTFYSFYSIEQTKLYSTVINKD